ncbi:MAG: hypothetical protein JHC40_20765 [Burkholderiales bacterium]|jgi:uncharacterized protein|nr:hypothetical protein [Burkholderiales bacterium]
MMGCNASGGLGLCHRLALVSLLLCANAPAARSAAFDCGRAANTAETLVCGDAVLSRRDDWLSSLYGQAMRASKEASLLRQQQRRWIVQVRGKCTTRLCLTEVYDARITELVVALRKARGEEVPQSADVAACLAVADRASRGELSAILAKSEGWLEEPRIQELLATEQGVVRQGEHWRIDLDHDGIPDNLIMLTEGTMRASSAYARAGRKGAVHHELNLFESGIMDLQVVQLNGRGYVSSWRGNELNKLWKLGDAGFESVCAFRAVQALVENTVGSGLPVCSPDKLDKRRAVEFTLQHAVDAIDIPDWSWSKYPIAGMARIDIDNDGQADNLIRVSFNSSAGRGCSATHLALIDDTRTRIPKSPQNKLLFENLAGCASLEAFTFDRAAFIEIDNGGGNVSVYQIVGDKANPVCESRGRWDYEVDLVL